LFIALGLHRNSINYIHSIYDFPRHSLVQLQGSSLWPFTPLHTSEPLSPQGLSSLIWYVDRWRVWSQTPRRGKTNKSTSRMSRGQPVWVGYGWISYATSDLTKNSDNLTATIRYQTALRGNLIKNKVKDGMWLFLLAYYIHSHSGYRKSVISTINEQFVCPDINSCVPPSLQGFCQRNSKSKPLYLKC
jgi:hypothetical protein